MQSINKKHRALMGPIVFLLTLLLSSCVDHGNQQEGSVEQQPESQAVTVILGEMPTKTGRYIGTYDEVTGVSLTYGRSDGLGVTDTIELQLVTTGFGADLTPTSAWVGTLESVIPGANYDFAAVAYDAPTEAEISDCRAQIDVAAPFQETLFWSCWRSYYDYEPKGSTQTYNDEDNTYFAVNLFEGSVDTFQIQAGTNPLQLRMMPILKPEARFGAIPYISKVERPDRYSASQNLDFIVEFKGPQGSQIELNGTVTGTCTTEARDQGTCEDVFGTITFAEKNENGLITVCPVLSQAEKDADSNWCIYSTGTIVQNYTAGTFQLPANPPVQLSVSITLSLRDATRSEELGLSNQITFDMFSDTIDQSSQLVFMPTLNDISLIYEMKPDSADLYYDFEIQGLSSEIEIYANLDYQDVTPLGFPAPYLKITNTDDGRTEKTVSGLIDKNDLYSANLKLNFVHRSTGFVYASEYPLPAYGKPKNSLPWDNWRTLLVDGICNHCDLQNIANPIEPVVWRDYHTWSDYDGDGVLGFQSKYFDRGTWSIGDPGTKATLHGGYLKYATLENSFLDDVSFTNVNFQGANLRNVEISNSTFDGSLFINSLIYNTTFRDSTVNDAVFSPEDYSPTTQNLPYTDLAFLGTQGSNVTLTGLTTKLDIQSSMFINLQMNDNLIYQSTFDGMSATGQFQNNDVVESTISGGSFADTSLIGTSFVSTSLANISMTGTDLSTTWFDKASGTTFSNVACDSNTVLPTYGNILCDPTTGLSFVGDDNREFVLSLPSGKSRASYLYEEDADSFRLNVTAPDSITVETTSTDSNINFTLRRSSDINTIIYPTNSGVKTTAREDGNYNTTVKYYTGLPALTDPNDYYFAYVTGGEGVFYIFSYYEEQTTP